MIKLIPRTTKEPRDTMAGMGALSCFPGAICPSQAHLHKLRGGQGCTNSGGNSNQGLPSNKHPIWTPPRIVPAQPQPHCPGVKPITRNQSGAIWKSFCRLKGLLPRRHTVGQKEKAVPGHRTYCRMFRGGTRGGKSQKFS